MGPIMPSSAAGAPPTRVAAHSSPAEVSPWAPLYFDVHRNTFATQFACLKVRGYGTRGARGMGVGVAAFVNALMPAASSTSPTSQARHDVRSRCARRASPSSTALVLLS